MRRPLLLAALLLATRVAAPAVASEPERHLLLRIADAEDPGRDEALESWKTLSVVERTKRAREALRAADPALALAAAVALPAWALDLDELHVKSKAMERDPVAWFDPPPGLADLDDGSKLGFGAPDLPAIWKALAARDPEPAGIGYSRTHRVFLPEQVPLVVPLLETAGPTAFRALLWDLSNQAESVAGDEHHAEFVRAFRYGLLRLQAEAARKPRPTFAEVPVLEPRVGVPAEFIELARASFAKDGKGFDLGGLPEDREVPGRGPEFWLHRWAQRLKPSEEDATFLVDLIEWATPPQTKEWAARAVARLGGRAGGHALERVLASPAGRQAAAAERALGGDRRVWDELVGAGQAGEYLWLVDPEAARVAAWKQMRAGDGPKELETEERWFLAYAQGVEIAEGHLDWLGGRLEAEGAPLGAEARFVAACHPAWLTRARAELLAKRWAGQVADHDVNEPHVTPALAALEVCAPEATRALLRTWAQEAKDEDAREGALALLMRLGDPALVARMVAAWPESLGPYPALLGRVRAPEVEALLRREASSEGTEREATAVEALARFYGCPEPLAAYLGPSPRDDRELDAATWAAVKALVLAKDPVGAVLRRTRASGPYVEGVSNSHIAGFGLVKDPRVVERLHLWRDRRDMHLYWVATACLALQGEERARAEWRAFLGEARTFLLDSLQEGRWFTLDGDPEWVATWVSRLDANCCYGWHAQEVLHATFPTFPFGHYPGGAGRTRRGAEAWFARFRGSFVRSALLDGWIPGPR